MRKIRTGLYDREYLLIEHVQQLLDSGERDPDRLTDAFRQTLQSFTKLLTETEKINFIVDRHYTRLVKTQKNLLLANQELELISVNDKLTGLFNRRKFDEVFSREILRIERFGGTGSLIFADIDHFKAANDTYGHLVGDQVLVQIAEILLSNIRRTDYCFRWGGEEFLILLTETSQLEALAIAEKLRSAIAGYGLFPVGKVTASFGVREYTAGWDQADWIVETDRALYRAKLRGRNCIEGAPVAQGLN